MNLLHGFIALAFPPSCLLCHESLPDFKLKIFCQSCQELFEWAPPFEEPFSCKTEDKTPYIRKILPTFNYEGGAEALVMAYKGGARRYLSEGMSALMALQWLEAGFPFPDLIVPVPSSPLANFKRGFSPSFLLAETLGALFSRPVWDGLKAEVSFVKQSQKTKEEREALPEGHLYLKKSAQKLKDKHLLLVDDVMTTGHTLHLASACLLEGCPRQIDALLFAQAKL